MGKSGVSGEREAEQVEAGLVTKELHTRRPSESAELGPQAPVAGERVCRRGSAHSPGSTGQQGH